MGISVTGGYVYRGATRPWQGKYIFGDWSKSFAEMDGQIFFATKAPTASGRMEARRVDGMKPAPYMLAFAQDERGEVYALTSITTGPVGGHDKIYRIVSGELKRKLRSGRSSGRVACNFCCASSVIGAGGRCRGRTFLKANWE